MNEIVLMPLHAGQLNIYQNRGPRTVVRCGRRFGKTIMLEAMAENWAMRGKRVGFFAPDYKRISESYERVIGTLAPARKSASKNSGEIKLRSGGLIDFWTLGDEHAGRSREYDEVIIDEAGMVKKGLESIVEQAIKPTLLKSNGSITMAGTPLGVSEDSYFYKACMGQSPEGWKEFHAPSSANPTIPRATLLHYEATTEPRVWQQEYLAEFIDWRGASFFSLDKLLIDGKGVPYPSHCDYVFAVVDSAMKDGSKNDGTAVVYCARSQYAGSPLVILDWDIVQINSDLLVTWLPNVFKKLEFFAKECGARLGSFGAFIEDKASGITLNQHAQRQGWPATPIDSTLTSQGKDARALMASSPVYRGEVKFSEYAFNKTITYKQQTKNHLVSQVTSYILSDPDAAKRADDLFDGFAYSVCIALNGPDGY